MIYLHGYLNFITSVPIMRHDVKVFSTFLKRIRLFVDYCFSEKILNRVHSFSADHKKYRNNIKTLAWHYSDVIECHLRIKLCTDTYFHETWDTLSQNKLEPRQSPVKVLLLPYCYENNHRGALPYTGVLKNWLNWIKSW